MSAGSYDWLYTDLADGGYYTTTFNTYRGYYGRTHTDQIGYDCSLMECPRGDNPDTPGVNEIQRIHCSAMAGGFYLRFRQNTTEFINWFDPAPVVEQKIEKIISIGNVTVSFTNDTLSSTGGHGSGKGICNASYADIEFFSELGDLPPLTVYGSTLQGKKGWQAAIPKINITELQAGTRENVECSAHGYCNEDIGMCTCDNGYVRDGKTSRAASNALRKCDAVGAPSLTLPLARFARTQFSSDGQGGLGHRGDCGFKYSETQAFLPVEEGE